MKSFVAIFLGLCVAACATPLTLSRLNQTEPVMPHIDVNEGRFHSFDGAELGLTVWQAEQDTPDYVVVGVHGMNDYANAFHRIAPWLAERGVTTYAYDQRGFGRSVGRGIWPETQLMRDDLRVAIKLVQDIHPDTPIAIIGISMGGAVAMTLFGGDNPPQGVDRLILSGPGVRGWSSLNPLYKGSLWLSTHVRPGWVVRPPKGVKIEPSDNIEMLRALWLDPLSLKDNRIDQVYGVVSLMEEAHAAAPRLDSAVPTLLTYGAKDIVIPRKAMKRTVSVLAPHVQTAYYANGYHMLLRDLQAEVVFADILSFLKDPSAERPSGAPMIPLK